ncbi:MAG TPA: hypothetical protein PLK75_07260 [Bacteroidales bacterium]|nr:hypothetical protein [Bacteroidales bacterium]
MLSTGAKRKVNRSIGRGYGEMSSESPYIDLVCNEVGFNLSICNAVI